MKTIFLMGLLVGCLVTLGSVQAQPLSDSDYIWIEPAVKTVSSIANGQKFRLAVMINNTTSAAALALPFTFAGHPGLRVDTTVGTPPMSKGVTYGPAGAETTWWWRSSLVDNIHQTILLGFVNENRPGFITSRDTLCYIHFVLDGGGVSDTSRLDTTALPPSNHFVLTNDFAYDFVPVWGAGTIRVVPNGVGDLNGDGLHTARDIVFLVIFVAKGGPAPASMSLADVNCNGAVNLADVVWLVNFVFKGGPEPMSGCGLWQSD